MDVISKAMSIGIVMHQDEMNKEKKKKDVQRVLVMVIEMRRQARV